MANSFIAQTSIAQSLSASYPGQLATSAPAHIAHGLNTSRQVVTVTPTAANGATYTLTLTQFGVSVEYAFLADGDATAAEIVDGLVALVNAGTQQITAVDGGNTFTLVNDQYSSEYEFTVATAASAGALAAATTVAQAADLADGVFVVFDSAVSSDPMGVRLPASAGDVTTVVGNAGVVLRDAIAHVRTSNGTSAPQMVGLLRKGHVYVKVEEAVSANAAVYVRYAAGGNGVGSFGAAAGSSERALLNGAVYRTAASANGIAMLEINIIGG